MRDVFVNGFGACLPNTPISSSEMEDYLGCIGNKPSRHRALVLRQIIDENIRHKKSIF